jgi:hypothetical protein
MGAFRVTEFIAEQRRLVDSQREYTEALTERYRALADLQTATSADFYVTNVWSSGERWIFTTDAGVMLDGRIGRNSN